MRITKKTILYIIITELFLFIILPSLLLGINGNFHKVPDSKAPVPEIFTNKIQTPEYINVYRHTYGETESVPFEDYVKGVVAGEMQTLNRKR